MAGVKISNLPAATTPLAGTELVPVVQGASTVKVSAANLGSVASYTATGTGAVVRTVTNKLGEFVTPQDFGAVGNGIANDTTAWTNWISAAGSKYIPKGNYLVSGFVQKYVNGTFTGNYSVYSAGFGALAESGENIAYTTAIGSDAGRYSYTDYSTFVGSECGRNVTGNENTAIGYRALKNCTTGEANTAVGNEALASLVSYYNCTGLGYNTDVTNNNQVQLGNSFTTTYAYGAVQNRSDARDKADIQDTVLGLDFVKTLRPVDFRWDYREDYDWGEKDGSKKRSRFHHGLIAQEVAVACTSLNVDFGGLQDHAKTGGKDVLSIGYEELIGPMIKAIQELTAKVESLESQLSNLK